MTISGLPLKRARSVSSWVAIPTGQVFRWHWRAITQPIATSAKDRGNQDVAGKSHPAIDAQGHARAKASAQKSFMRVAQADFPRQAGVLDGGKR
jgi:hypothetical protein